MRFLLVSPASIYSTTDVYDGLLHGLRSLGHEVAPYDFLMYQWHADAFLRQWLPEAGMEDWIPPESELDDDPPPEQAEKYHEYIADMLYQSSKDALCQALDYEVDWVLVVSGLLFSHRVLRMFRQVPSVKVGAICTESPYNDPEQAELIRMCDAAWTNERLSQRRLAESAPGVPVGYLPMAYHPLKHRPRKRAKKLDVVFVGVGYPERIALLEGANWDGIELGLYGDWQFVEPHSPLRPYVKQGIIENEEAIELYQQSRLGLNLYRSCVDYWRGSGGEAPEGESCNPTRI